MRALESRDHGGDSAAIVAELISESPLQFSIFLAKHDRATQQGENSETIADRHASADAPRE
jgi:hypothetical protein